MSTKRIGLALSGGGIRGFAHLGVLKALEENNIPIAHIAGTSAGALMGCFSASGLKAEEIFNLLKDKDLFSLSTIKVPHKGFLNFERLMLEMYNTLPHQSFESLLTPLTVTVSNLNLGRVEYIKQGDVIQASVASSSIPAVFTPVKIGDYEYCDGGVFNNLPINQLTDDCEIIIAVNISPIKEETEIGTISDIAMRAFQLGINANTIPELSSCDVYIEPANIRNYGLLDSKHIDTIYEAGYLAGLEKMEEIKRLME